MSKRTSIAAELLPGGRKIRHKSFVDFLLSEVETDKGRYTFKRHAVYRPIAELLDRVLAGPLTGARLDIKKGTQVGFSTLLASFILFAAACRSRTAGYFLPDRGFARDFDQERVDPIIETSRTLQALSGRDVTGAHQFGNSYVFVVGLHNQKGAISRPMDLAFFDEVDVIPKVNREIAEERLDASDLGFTASFCRGLIPGGGIDKAYDEGCGYRWTVTCPHCGAGGQVLEELFPACVAQVNGEWALICVHCRKPYDVQTSGAWVPQRPKLVDERRWSFQVPQLIIPQVALWRVMQKWNDAQGKPSKLANFYSSALALVRAGAGQPITDRVLDERHRPYSLSLRTGVGPRFAGLDTGDTCHLWVYDRAHDGARRLVWFEPIISDDAERIVAERREQLGIVALVTDAKPLRSLARKLCYQAPDSTWVQDFVERGEITEHEESFNGRQYLRVTLGREESLDDFSDLFHVEPSDGGWILPSTTSGAELDEVRTQLKLLQRASVKGAKGEAELKYRRNVNNHYALAGNSALVAEHLWNQENGSGKNKPPTIASGAARRSDIAEGYGL